MNGRVGPLWGEIEGLIEDLDEPIGNKEDFLVFQMATRSGEH